jgi:hypothetical protein
LRRKKKELSDGYRKTGLKFDLRRKFFRFSVNREPISALEHIVPNLVNGKEYEFRVAGVNKAGPGEFGKEIF